MLIILTFVSILIYKTIYRKNSDTNTQTKENREENNEENKFEKIVIQKGDVLALTLNKTKLSNDDSSDILKELKKLVNINKCLPGDFYEIIYDNINGEWTNFCYYPSGIFYYEISRSPESEITAEKKQLETVTVKYEKEGVIESSLWDAMISCGVPENIICNFANIFACQVDFVTGAKQGDSFKIVYEIKTAEKKETRLYSKILAGEYKTASKSYRAFYFKTRNGVDGYFDNKGKSLKRSFLKAPLQFSRISSYFSTRRLHPILKTVRPHLGIDYAAPSGTPVSSVGNGIVLKAQYSGGFGNLVTIRHSNGYETCYGHLSRFAKGIKAKAKVKQGQVIGYVGMTGLATGPHLDFRIKLNGKFFNYLKMKQPPAVILCGKDKIDFENSIKEYFK